ncbi:hypothetical protein SLE2022_201500 [Rubroshorea leprosula]
MHILILKAFALPQLYFILQCSSRQGLGETREITADTEANPQPTSICSPGEQSSNTADYSSQTLSLNEIILGFLIYNLNFQRKNLSNFQRPKRSKLISFS